MRYLKSFSIVFLITLFQSEEAQVVIKENIELNTNPAQQSKKAKSANELGFAETMFVATESGSLQFYLENFTKYRNPLNADNKLVVRIKNGAKNISKILQITPDQFSEPMMTPLEGFCGDDFYLYGSGMFFYDYPRMSTNSAYDTYANISNSGSNFGNSRIMQAKKDESISYIKFGLPSVADTSIIINGSTLQLGAFVDTKPSAKYSIGRVTSLWSENTLTWLNKPSSTFIETYEVGRSASSGLFSIDISKAAESWLKYKQENNGVSLELSEVANLRNDIRFFTTENDFIKPRFNVGFSVPTKIPTDTLYAGNVAAGDTVYVRYENGSNEGLELLDIELIPFIREIFEEFISRTEVLNRLYFALQDNDFSLPCQPEGNDIEFFQFYSAIVEDSSSLELNLEIPDPKEVWPTVRQRDGGNPNERNIKILRIFVTENNQPLVNHQVKISGRLLPNTGGHDHTNTTQANLGIFLNTLTQETGESELLTTTNEEGRIEIAYTAMEIGAELEIKVESVTEEGSVVMDTLQVRVPNMEFLGASNYYELVGAPQYNNSTNDPCRSKSSLKSQHSFGHFGTGAFNNKIKKLAESFYTTNDSTKLRINDISLEYGGLFDTGNKWFSPHSSHRLGKEGDIGVKTIDKSGACVEDQELRLIQDQIDQISFVNTII